MSNAPWELHSQIVVYLKGWYTETDTMADLKTIISKLCGTESQYVTDIDVMGLVLDTFMFATKDRETSQNVQAMLIEVFKGKHKKPWNIWQKDQNSAEIIEIIDACFTMMRHMAKDHLPWCTWEIKESLLPANPDKKPRGIEMGLVYA